MRVYIAGAGKLASELRDGLPPQAGREVLPWPGDPAGALTDALPHALAKTPADNAPTVVVHAGSGRELPAITAFCARTGAVLVELSTGSALEHTEAGFPIVLCPNTNILMLKFMAMLARSGSLFQGCAVQLTESHQAGKTSVPGTAVAMAEALGLPAAHIVSVRAPAEQMGRLGIPEAQLARHAFHRIQIEDGACALTLETRVQGDAPYAAGVGQILDAIAQHPLAARTYAINEFIELGWL